MIPLLVVAPLSVALSHGAPRPRSKASGAVVSHLASKPSVANRPQPSPFADTAPSDGSSGQLAVDVGRSHVIRVPDEITKVSITDPKTADVAVLSGHEVLVNGKRPGITSLIVWTRKGHRNYDVMVNVDTGLLQRTIAFVTGAHDIVVERVGDSIILAGKVANTSEIARAQKVAEGFAPKVINLLQAAAVQQVEVDVDVIETEKTGGLNAGMHWGSAHTSPNGDTSFNPDYLTFGETGGPPFGGKNLLSFGQLDRVAAQLSFLVSTGRAKLLADPKLVAISGGKANFLVGGEVPVPEAQQFGNVTVTWREYGVKLNIEPTVLPDGRVDLKVNPEVSTLDFADGVRVGQFLIPALSSRKAGTEVILKPGQGLIIGGLLQHNTTENVQKFPFLGDIPILGELFKSRQYQKNETELQILVTPKLV